MGITDYNPKVGREQGGSNFFVRARDGGSIKGQATTGGAVTQAAHIADAATTGFSSGTAVKINSILAALENVGILATA